MGVASTKVQAALQELIEGKTVKDLDEGSRSGKLFSVCGRWVARVCT